MRSSTYLQLSKSNTYYFRLRIPLHLVSVIGRKEIHRSLKTSIYQEALVRAGRLIDASQRLISSAINGVVDLSVLTGDCLPERSIKRSSVLSKERPKSPPKNPNFSVVVERYYAEQAREGISEPLMFLKLFIFSDFLDTSNASVISESFGCLGSTDKGLFVKRDLSLDIACAKRKTKTYCRSIQDELFPPNTFLL